MRVLIINSDSPRNRGDRAILAGLIETVRGRWPDASIWSLSQYAERDEEWFGIRFLPVSPYSVNPLDLLRLLRFARRFDVVLWGGGEILKDYTNQAGLVYWAMKMLFVSWVNPRLYGAYQGIGPTRAATSKRLIRFAADRTRGFLVRDAESRQKLVDWGVRAPVVESYDPAVAAPVAEWNDALAARVATALDVEPGFLGDMLGVGVRRWFHYKQGAVLPFALRRRSAVESEGPEFARYRDALVELIDREMERRGGTVLFFPMHMSASEGDDALAHDIISRLRSPERARVLDADVLSPAEFTALVGRCRAFLASRLHSAILAAVAGVPATVLYYVDKGRLFFEQLGLQELSRPIDILLEDGAVDEVEGLIERLYVDREAITGRLRERLGEMTDRVSADFAAVVPGRVPASGDATN
ncbi:polysaccharide pyruvyl transferase family protein [Agromyces sp. SYSU T00194]|uniref:polysaccharide pyruvyl transferase family protein n=1 Tax=Agromyces chitinivorans TaxID=3158560 RepID=UPI003396B2EB